MNYKSLVVSILLLFAIGFVYDKFKLSIDRNDKKEELDIIKKYLLNESDYYAIDQLSSINKPLLWIHLEYNKNSRKWFYDKRPSNIDWKKTKIFNNKSIFRSNRF